MTHPIHTTPTRAGTNADAVFLPIRRNTPPAVRVEILTDTLAVAWQKYCAFPSAHARRAVSAVAQARMRAQLPAPGPDPVELEVAAMFVENEPVAKISL